MITPTLYKFAHTPHPEILLINPTHQDHHTTLLHHLDLFTPHCLYLTTRTPTHNLQKRLERINTPTHHVTFIDTITKKIQSPTTAPNTIYTNTHLPDLLHTLQQTASSLPGHKTLIIDQLPDLLLDHDEHTLLRFLDILIKRLKILHTKIILIADVERLTDLIKKKIHNLTDHTL